jgi:hypothetical protein
MRLHQIEQHSIQLTPEQGGELLAAARTANGQSPTSH